MTQQSIDRAPPVNSAPVARKPQPSSEERTSIWPFIWTLFAFKAIALSTILFFAARSHADVALLTTTHWFFLVIPIIALSGRFAYHWRVRRVRRKRDQLRSAEWMLD